MSEGMASYLIETSRFSFLNSPIRWASAGLIHASFLVCSMIVILVIDGSGLGAGVFARPDEEAVVDAVAVFAELVVEELGGDDCPPELDEHPPRMPTAIAPTQPTTALADFFIDRVLSLRCRRISTRQRRRARRLSHAPSSRRA